MEADPMSEFEFETDGEADTEFEYDEFEADAEGVLGEAEEMELAAELLGVSDEAELDQFLGKLFKRIGRGLGKVIKNPKLRKLGGFLKGAIKKALPIAGGAVGTFFGGPVGTALGSKLASTAGDMFGLELEGLSYEDQEFEVARRVVRLGAQAVKNAALSPDSGSPELDAKKAMINAAKKHAPGMLRPATPSAPHGHGYGSGTGRSGRWLRRGRKIVLLGV
jgi:hypothetical protein